MKQSIIPLVFDSSLSLVLPKAFQGLKNIYCVLFYEKFQTNFRLSKKMTLEQLHEEKKVRTPSLTTTSTTQKCKILFVWVAMGATVQCDALYPGQSQVRSQIRSGHSHRPFCLPRSGEILLPVFSISSHCNACLFLLCMMAFLIFKISTIVVLE